MTGISVGLTRQSDLQSSQVSGAKGDQKNLRSAATLATHKGVRVMELIDLIPPEGVISPLKATSKKQALQELANKAEEITGLPSRVIFDGLLERERLGSTGMGNGIAIPHAKLADLDRLHGLFARAETLIDFDAIDDAPVDLIFVLLAPTNAGADHLKALARISRLLRNLGTCDKLRGEPDRAALHALITEPLASDAA